MAQHRRERAAPFGVTGLRWRSGALLPRPLHCRQAGGPRVENEEILSAPPAPPCPVRFYAAETYATNTLKLDLSQYNHRVIIMPKLHQTFQVGVEAVAREGEARGGGQ